MEQLDSLDQAINIGEAEPFQIGFAKTSITPDSIMPLAGYGARRPKEYEDILDSIFIRTIVIQSPNKKVALLTADLLIIHPLMTQALHERLQALGWNKNDVFLTATHTHSSIGQWAPGLVGGLFAGDYQEKVATIIADRMIQSLTQAEKTLIDSRLGYSSSENPDLVHNRLVQEKGIEDPYQKSLCFQTTKGQAVFSSFSAHATCLTSQSRKLSGDFPNYFHKQLAQDSTVLFSSYAAGPVASMGPETTKVPDQFERTYYLGKEIANRIEKPSSYQDSIEIYAASIPLQLGKAQFKVAKNLALRPYLFKYAFGDEPSQLSVLLLGKTLLVGTPCDFSGELAVPLYKYAKERGLELIITSFNGGYIGYITKDEWYDLEKYETRTMNWYGPGNGAYFSEIIQKLIESVSENN